MIQKYDNHLSFDLPYGYEAISGTNDDGTKTFSINCGVGIDDSGEPTAEVKVLVRHLDGALDPANVNFEGDFPARIGGSISEMGFGLQIQTSFSSSPGRTLKIQFLFFLVGVSCEKDSYAFIAIKTGKEEVFSENCDLIAEHLNRVLGCIKLDGKSGHFQKLTGRDVQQTLKEGKTDKDSVGSFFDSPVETKPQKTGASFINVQSANTLQIKTKIGKTEKEKAAEEAEKRKAVETEKAKNAEAAKEKAWTEWETACVAVEKQRFDALEKEKADRKTALHQQAENKRDTELQKVEQEKNGIEDELKEAAYQMSMLGVFKFAEKNRLKKRVEQLKNETLPALEVRRGKIAETYSEEVGKIDQTVLNETEQMKRGINERFPMPVQPEKPEKIIEQERKEQEERKKEEIKKQAILEYLRANESENVDNLRI